MNWSISGKRKAVGILSFALFTSFGSMGSLAHAARATAKTCSMALSGSEVELSRVQTEFATKLSTVILRALEKEETSTLHYVLSKELETMFPLRNSVGEMVRASADAGAALQEKMAAVGVEQTYMESLLGQIAKTLKPSFAQRYLRIQKGQPVAIDKLVEEIRVCRKETRDCIERAAPVIASVEGSIDQFRAARQALALERQALGVIRTSFAMDGSISSERQGIVLNILDAIVGDYILLETLLDQSLEKVGAQLSSAQLVHQRIEKEIESALSGLVNQGLPSRALEMSEEGRRATYFRKDLALSTDQMKVIWETWDTASDAVPPKLVKYLKTQDILAVSTIQYFVQNMGAVAARTTKLGDFRTLLDLVVERVGRLKARGDISVEAIEDLEQKMTAFVLSAYTDYDYALTIFDTPGRPKRKKDDVLKAFAHWKALPEIPPVQVK